MLGDVLKVARNENGLNQEDVAAKIADMTGRKLTRQAVNNWEKGKRVPGKHWWNAIESVLGLDQGAVYQEILKSTGKGKLKTDTYHPPTDAFGAVLSALFEQITEWLSEDGRDSGAALDFVVEFQDRFDEFKVFLKKRKQSGEVGTLPPVQDRKVANGNR